MPLPTILPVSLGRVGNRLATLASDFDPRTYGQSKLSALIEKTGAFDLRRSDSGHMQIRAKPATSARPSARKPGQPA